MLNHGQMQPWPQGVPRSYGTLNSRSQICRLWDVNWRTVQGSVFLGVLPVVHQKWNIRCSDLLHKGLRAEIALIWKAWAQFDEPMNLSNVQSVYIFLSSFKYTLLLDSDVFKFRMDLTLRYHPAPPVCQVCSEHFLFSITPHWHFQPSRPTACVTGQAKERRQPSWHEIIMTMWYPRQGKVSSHLVQKPHSCIFHALDQTPTSTYKSPKQNQKRNGQDTTRQAIFTIISVYVKPRTTWTFIYIQKRFPKATSSSDLTALDIQINVWWALGFWWGSTDPVNYLKFLYIYKNNHHRSKMRRDRQEIVLLFKFSSGYPFDHKIPCTLWPAEFPF